MKAWSIVVLRVFSWLISVTLVRFFFGAMFRKEGFTLYSLLQVKSGGNILACMQACRPCSSPATGLISSSIAWRNLRVRPSNSGPHARKCSLCYWSCWNNSCKFHMIYMKEKLPSLAIWLLAHACQHVKCNERNNLECVPGCLHCTVHYRGNYYYESIVLLRMDPIPVIWQPKSRT
jgi:hypothetical protein